MYLPEFVQREAESTRKLRGWPLPPIVQEDDHGLRPRHVVVYRDHIKPVSTQRLQHRLQFDLKHSDIARNNRLLVGPKKRSPRVQPHARVDRRSHFRDLQIIAPDSDLIYRAVLLSLMSHDLRNIGGIELRTPGSSRRG